MSDQLKDDDDEFDLVDEEESTFTEQKKDMPVRGSSEWNDYLMSLFTPDELYNGEYPTLNGMRRIAILVLGEPVKSNPAELKSSLDHTSNGRAYCVYQLWFEDSSGRIREYSGAADSFEGNTDKAYAIYPVCIAESRAEARAYRKALLLTTVTAEEIKGNEKAFDSVIKTGYDEDEPMSSTQEKVVTNLSKKLEIDIEKLVKNMRLPGLTKGSAVLLVKELNKYQGDKSLIPEEIKIVK